LARVYKFHGGGNWTLVQRHSQTAIFTSSLLWNVTRWEKHIIVLCGYSEKQCYFNYVVETGNLIFVWSIEHPLYVRVCCFECICWLSGFEQDYYIIQSHRHNV